MARSTDKPTIAQDPNKSAPPPSYLNDEQILQLLRPLNHTRVGKDGQGFSHLEAYDVRAHLNRCFGFGRWSQEILAMELVSVRETKTSKGKDAVEVIYRAQCRLVVNAPDGTVLATYTEWAVGDSLQPSLPNAHDQAIKTAESQALKRCAINLGDQFGLSLYNGGSLRPLVIRTLNGPALASNGGGADGVDADLPELNREGTNAPLANREVSSPPVHTPKQTAQQDRPAPEPAGEPETLAETLREAFVAPMDGEEAREMRAAEATITELFPGAVEDTGGIQDVELPADPEVDGVAKIGAMVTRARQLPGDERLQVLKEALELSVAQGLRQHRLPNGVTVGAALLRELQEAGQAS